MSLSTVTWRQAVAAVAATCIGLLAVMVVVRADGIAAVDAASARATAWFVHQPTGRVVLVDGYRGAALASIEMGAQNEELTIAEGTSGAFVLNDTTAEARPIDTVDLRLGTPFGLTSLGHGQAMGAVGQAGLVVVSRGENEATVVPADGEPVSFAVDAGTATEIARDGSIWSLVDGDLVRTTSSATSRTELGADGALLSLLGSVPVVVDVEQRRVRVGTGDWQPLPTDADPSEIIAQTAGPAGSCAWVGADDDLWCVGTGGIEESATIAGLDIDGGDLLAIAGDAAVVVRRGPSSIVRLDWRAETILEDVATSVAPGAVLRLQATTDLVWVDDVEGESVWAVNPWSIRAIDKNDQGTLVLGEDGGIVDEGQSGQGTTTGPKQQEASEPELREPDRNGIDDDPIAVDDPVTARSGTSVSVEVTANDYDPDGEAIAVSEVGVPGHGSVDIGTATRVVYTPDAGYVGFDQFEYTIVDGNGSTASATVTVELLAAATNKPPVGVVDRVETGANVSVVIDVLLNDVDPERDALRIGSFSPPEERVAHSIGTVTETVGDSGLAALEFTPAEGFEGTAIFSYRPVDALDAIGDDVEVRVEVARNDDPNRSPVARPDAVRLRRNVVTPLQVLLNDTDPDGDVLTVTLPDALPPGLEVQVEGAQLAITARAGAAVLAPFEYEIDDGHGHTARGSVLVGVIDDIEPNRPPVVGTDSAKVVVGESVIIDVTANDVDPDGDPLTVVSVTQPESEPRGEAVVFSRSAIQFSPGLLGDDSRQSSVRFTYTVSDGNGHEVVGDVTVTVLPEALVEPPFARDDSTFTYVDVPVTVDVLRNDGDPSGGRPSLAGTPGCPSGGTATVMPDSQVQLDPPPGRSGSFRCNYEVTNASGRRASASIIVSVRERQITNEPPVAVNDLLSVEVGTSRSIDVTLNDRDPDGGTDSSLEVLSSTAPVIGSAQRNGNVIMFTADDRTGAATINYQVADADGGVSLGRLQVTVTERANMAPRTTPDAQTIFGPGVATPFSVLGNDSDPDNTPGGMSLVSATLASGDGTVSVSGDVVWITPTPSFLGQVVASYVMRDGAGLTATSTATLTIEKLPNRPPDARDDNSEVVNGGNVSTPVLFNDVDPDGDVLTLSILSGPDPALGSARVVDGRSINFAAVPGASGTAVITYQVSDGQLTDDAVLRVSVRPCSESAPVANSGFLKTGYQQPIGVDLSSFAMNGSIVDVSGPVGFDGMVYTPPAGENGNVVINYAVVNSCRMRASGQVTIDVNQDPLAQPLSAQVDTGTERTIPVSDLATDVEVLTISTSTGAPTWVTTRPDRLVVAPPLGTGVGNYSWTTTVVDPGGLATSVSVTVTVGNRPPIANGDTIDASAAAPVTASIVDNDSDPSAPASGLTIHAIASSTITFPNGATGTVTVLGDGRRVVVDPGTGQGQATFTYTVRSTTGEVSAPAIVTVIGPAPPPPPTTVPPTTVPPTTVPTTTTSPPVTPSTTIA